MPPRYHFPVLVTSLLVALLFAGVTKFAASTITLRSGSVPPTATDPVTTYYVEPSGHCVVPFATPFGPADCAAADAGPPA